MDEVSKKLQRIDDLKDEIAFLEADNFAARNGKFSKALELKCEVYKLEREVQDAKN
jgi:hypothetical protein